MRKVIFLSFSVWVLFLLLNFFFWYQIVDFITKFKITYLYLILSPVVVFLSLVSFLRNKDGKNKKFYIVVNIVPVALIYILLLFVIYAFRSMHIGF